MRWPADPTCGGALTPGVDDNCLEEFTFCGPIRIISTYTNALPDPVLDIGSPDGIITGCTNKSFGNLCIFFLVRSSSLKM